MMPDGGRIFAITYAPGARFGDAVALLCSKEASFITGQVLAVDGGASLMDAAVPLAIQQAALPAGLSRMPRERSEKEPAILRGALPRRIHQWRWQVNVADAASWLTWARHYFRLGLFRNGV